MNESHKMRLRALAVYVAVSLLSACGTAPIAVRSTPSEVKPGPMVTPASQSPQQSAIGYDRADAWLCRPGRRDTCAEPLSVTVVGADGLRTIGLPQATRIDAPVDCFYVYPTVSGDVTPNSDMSAGPEEMGMAFHQLSPFRTRCRLFAPVYRQVTVAALRSLFTGTPMAADWALAYGDVLSAWKHYLANDNRGRGVVLIGHSQGSILLSQLIAREIEGKPVQRQIVSAILPGTNLLVPKGKDVGGTFQSMPLCRSVGQTGCVISYVAFRASAPPPAMSLFGRASGGNVVACTNPAALSGGDARPMAWFATRQQTTDSVGQGPAAWQALFRSIETPFFATPGLITTRCMQDSNGSYLSVRVHGDARADDIGGDLTFSGSVVPSWGLHLIDMNLGLGDLVDVVGQQSKAYLALTQ